MRNDCGLRIVDCGFRRDAMHRWSRPSIRCRLLSIRNPKSEIRNGISLIEILISMFVLLFGLMGVASIFPVGSHYMTEGEKFDFGSALTQNAFEEMEIRKILDPHMWQYLDVSTPVIDCSGNFSNVNINTTGRSFVIDPLGGAQTPVPPAVTNRFPGVSPSSSPTDWGSLGTWPAQRVSVKTVSDCSTPGVLKVPVAETIFRLRDDLAVELPKQPDHPGIQRWSVDGTNLLARQYNGNYSWLATVVPTSEQAILGLQPANTNYGQYAYDVSVVVFRKRDLVPSKESERLIDAQILNEGELAIFSTITNPSDASAEVDAAVEDIRPGNWIAVMGVNQTNGNFLMKWYRLLSLDDETDGVDLNEDGNDDAQGRYAMITGPDWPTNSYKDLRAAILPGAISVVTRQMRIED